MEQTARLHRLTRLGVGVFCLLLIAGAVIGLWQAGWIFSNANVNRQAHQTQQGYGNQTTLHERFTADLNTIASEKVQIDAHPAEKADLRAEQASTAGDACGKASQISGAYPLTGTDATWVSRNCSGSTLSTSSPYFQAGNQ